MAALAVEGIEERLAAHNLCIGGVPPRRYCQVLRVEHDHVEQLLADLQATVALAVAVGGVEAKGLRLCAVARSLGHDRVGNADIARKRRAALLADRGSTGLPSEAAELEPLVLNRPDLVGAPGDAIAVLVVGIGVRADLLLRDRPR